MLRCRGSLLNASGDWSACVPCSVSGVHLHIVLLVAHVMCILRCKECVYCSHCGAFMYRKVLRTVAWMFFRVKLGKIETEEEPEFESFRCLQIFSKLTTFSQLQAQNTLPISSYGR